MVLTNQKNYSAAVWHGLASVAFVCSLGASPARAQIVEAAGSRALGMAGAFVAVASDNSATWWNPAGIATGPFIDLGFGVSLTERPEQVPSSRNRVGSFALATPPAAFSYYRLRITDIQPLNPIAGTSADRETRGAEVQVESLSVGQTGVTLARTLTQGVHVGTTLKYVRGTLHYALEDALTPPSDLLERGDEYSGGDSQSGFDLDIGAIAVGGPLRLGAVVKNVLEPDFEAPGLAPDAAPARVVMRRQVRVGGAFDTSATGGLPLTVSLDADVVRYATPSGERRMLAFGGEYWVWANRLAVRTGGRVNTLETRDRSLAAGATVSLRSGLFIDGHLVIGRAIDEQGWGLSSRISF